MPRKSRSMGKRVWLGRRRGVRSGCQRRISVIAVRGRWGRRARMMWSLLAAGERKWIAMRIFSGILVAALIAAGGAHAASAGGGVKYASPQAAFEQGLGAYKSGYYEIAIPALEEAATNGAELNKFFAEFYLARIYSDNAS